MAATAAVGLSIQRSLISPIKGRSRVAGPLAAGDQGPARGSRHRRQIPNDISGATYSTSMA
jgi:hypothetical protein